MHDAYAAHESVVRELQSFGGFLTCTWCGKEEPVGDVGYMLRNGWPTCCGYTMLWITAEEVLGD